MQYFVRLISLLLVVMLLCGCTAIQSTDDRSDTDSSNNISGTESNEYEYIEPWEGETLIRSNATRADWGYMMLEKTSLNIYDTRTGERFYLCPDPLCEHEYDCPLQAFRFCMDFVVSPNESREGPVIYFETQDPGYEYRKGYEWGGYYMCRYDYASQTMQVLAGPYKPTGTTWAFDVKTNIIYHTVFESDENGTTYIQAYALNGNTAQWTYLCTLPVQAIPAYVEGDALFFNTISTIIYRLNMKDSEKKVEELEHRGKIYAGYIYYMEYSDTDKVTVSLPEELQRFPLYDVSYGYGEDHAADLYRIEVDMPTAKPELIMQNVSVRYNIKQSGGYICVAECEPRLAVAALIAGGRYYSVDDPTAPNGSKLITLFQYDRTYHIFDVETLQERVITLDKGCLSAPIFNRNGDQIVSLYSFLEPEQVIALNNNQSQYSVYGSLTFDFDAFQGATDQDVFVFGYEV
ncbi:MAG: hypothetical protein IJW40_06100 [Clostridia bacterium]|nr:hypothetical protein [Clostridia bacterium]